MRKLIVFFEISFPIRFFLNFCFETDVSAHVFEYIFLKREFEKVTIEGLKSIVLKVFTQFVALSTINLVIELKTGN